MAEHAAPAGTPAGISIRHLYKIFGPTPERFLQAVKDGQPVDVARAAVLKDPRVAKRAPTMDGFESNIGKYVSLAYLEAEKEAF